MLGLFTLLVPFVLLAVLIAIPVGLVRRKATEHAMLAEGRRVADRLQVEGAHGRPSGITAEIEAQRIIDHVIAPKFGGEGARLLRNAAVRQAVFEIIMEGFEPPGAIRATKDWSRDPAVPRLGDQSSTVIIERGTHNGLAYDLHAGGEVVHRRDGLAFTWRSEEAFRTWAGGVTPEDGSGSPARDTLQ